MKVVEEGGMEIGNPAGKPERMVLAEELELEMENGDLLVGTKAVEEGGMEICHPAGGMIAVEIGLVASLTCQTIHGKRPTI